MNINDLLKQCNDLCESVSLQEATVYPAKHIERKGNHIGSGIGTREYYTYQGIVYSVKDGDKKATNLGSIRHFKQNATPELVKKLGLDRELTSKINIKEGKATQAALKVKASLAIQKAKAAGKKTARIQLGDKQAEHAEWLTQELKKGKYKAGFVFTKGMRGGSYNYIDITWGDGHTGGLYNPR